MPNRTIAERVTILVAVVAPLEKLPARVERVESQIIQLRVEMRAGFSALQDELRAGDAETRSQMRVLHEDTKADIRLLAEHLARVLTRLDDRRR
jgi:hypothetical protein